MNPLLLKPEEAAEALGISRSRYYELVADGKIKTVKIGASRRVTPEALADFIALLEAGAA